MKRRNLIILSSFLLSTIINSTAKANIERNNINNYFNLNTINDQISEASKKSSLPSFKEYEDAISPYAFDSYQIQEEIHPTKDKTCQVKVNHEKVAFLTFDDGPSTTNTTRILSVLDKDNIKATFFVVGSQLDSSKEEQELLKQLYKEGHGIGNHTYSHDYNYLYPSRYVNTKNILKDLSKNEQTVKGILGEDFKFNVVRMPGGLYSWKNNKTLRKEFADNNIKFVDWNVLNGDAEGGSKSPSQLVQRFNQTFKDQNTVVILMHDTYGKESTVEALPAIINCLKEKGYSFGILN